MYVKDIREDNFDIFYFVPWLINGLILTCQPHSPTVEALSKNIASIAI